MTHVLIVGERRELHLRLKNLGARLTLFIEIDQIRPDDKMFYNRIIGLPTDASLHEWIAIAASVHRTDPFDAIGGFEDRMQNKAAAIAAALGLLFHTSDVVMLTRHKDRMRQLLNERGIDPTVNAKVATPEDIMAFASRYGFPVILKPTDGRASIGVSLIREQSDIRSALRWFQEHATASEMCVEQYLAGEEYSVEAFSEDGKHQVICITQKFKETEHFVEVGHCLPAEIGQSMVVRVGHLVRQMLSALDVQQGPSHTEIIITSDGPRIVETHVRAGGDQIPQLIHLAGGVDLLDLWVQQSLGDRVWSRVVDSPPPDRFAAIWFAVPQAIGIVERVEGIEEAKKIPGVAEVVIRHNCGAQLTGLHDSFARAAYALAFGGSRQEALARAQAAIQQLTFFVLC